MPTKSKKLQKSEVEDLRLKLIESENNFKKYCIEVASQNEEYKAINEKYLKTNEELSEKNSTIIRIMNEMRWNEAKSRQMFISSPVGIMYYDTTLFINELNFAFSEILSAPYNLLKGFDLKTMNDKKVLPAIKDAISGKTGHYEGFYKSTLSGKEVYVNFSTHPLYSREDSSVIIGGVLLAQDLTKWKHTQEKLEENEENLRLTLESIGDCVIVTNQNTEITNINTVAEKVLKIKKANIINKTASDIFSIYNTVLNKYLSCQIQTAIQENRSISIHENIELHAINGIKINSSFNISPIRKIDGEVIGAIMVFQDITEQIKIQQEIIESENKFKSLFDNSPTGIALFDIEGNVKEVNNVMLKILGSPSAEATKTINVLKFPPLVKIGFVNDFNECITTGNNVNRFAEYTTNWGKQIYVQYSISPHKEKDNKVIGVILNIVDITTQKQAEEKEKKYFRDLELITKSAIEMLELPLNADPLHFIGEKLKSIIGDNTVIINKYSVKTQTSSIEHVFCNEVRIKTFNELLNRNLEQLKFKKAPAIHDFNFTKKIVELNPVDFFINSCHFPEKESKKIIELQKINKVYFMGICPENNLLANIIIITYYNEIVENKEVIETFVNQASLLLQRQVALKNLNEAKEKAEESEKKFRTIFENANDGILVADAETKKFIFANKQMCTLTGYSFNELINLSVYDIHPLKYLPDELQKFEEQLKKIIRFVPDSPVLKKNGEIIYCDINSSPMELGGRKYLLGFFRDITNKKLIEQELLQSKKKIEESEKKFRELYEKSGDAILMLNNSLFTDCNQATVDLFKYKNKNEIIKLHPSELSPEYQPDGMNSFKKAEKMINHALKNGTNRFVWDHKRSDGEVFPAEVLLTAISNEENLKVVHAVVRDITARKKAELELILAKEKAEESDKLKSAFLANMSHELRTPINGIIGFSNLLHKTEINSEKKAHYISQINANSSLLLRLIDDIIDVAKIESGKLTIEKSLCNFTSIMNDLYLQYIQELKALNKNNIELIYNNNNSNLNIVTDHLRLKQVLINLLSNAIKFTNNGKIEYGCSIKDNELNCYVKDTGIGIKPENISKIFERFTQLELSISRKFGGTGLGLTISKNIIELLGGKIWVESVWEKGSTFYFTIPVEIIENNTNSNETEFSQPAKNDFSNYTILVAEDDDLNYMFIEEMLSETKINIIRANNGLDALNIVKTNNKINIVLMDIQMPVMDGYQCTKLILEIKPDLPVIAQTAFAITTEKEKSLKFGCIDYITKPINLKELISKIKKYLPNN